jgi:GNAT superfamily N-acetyltransferase
VFPESRATTLEVAGAKAMYDGVDSPCTQTFGLGLFGPVASADLDRIEKFFRDRGAPTYHEVCPLADASVVRLLNERSYQPFEFSNVLYQPISDFVSPSAIQDECVRARRIEPGEYGLWARTLADGWRDVAAEYMGSIADLELIEQHRSVSQCFVAEKNGAAIAAGSIHICEGITLFAGASTIPKWRKQGAQRALLAARLQYAAELGCDTAMIVAAPGSASQRNAERAGFRIAYTRIKWRLLTG